MKLRFIETGRNLVRAYGWGALFLAIRNKLLGRPLLWKIAVFPNGDAVKDVLFVSGVEESALPQCYRYRIRHQREQLEAANLTTDAVFYQDLDPEIVQYYRLLIFYRCPYTDAVGQAIGNAKAHNKRVFFDIDDLVFDTAYTDRHPYVRQMPAEEKKLYDDGVLRMGKTLSLCDAAITTTEALRDELQKVTPQVFINRNRASEEMWALSEKAYAERAAKEGDSEETFVLGYFSGSISHSPDFEQIRPVLARLLKKYPFLRLKVVGELALSDDMQPYASQILTSPFVSWKKLPELLASVDVDLAPIEDTVFNRAKSENKWMEAALVRVPTVASDCGAFHQVIEDGKTGLLCASPEQWEAALEKLISDRALCRTLGANAYRQCRDGYLTINTGAELARFLNRQAAPHMGVVLPSLGISGGIMVALTHASFMQDLGWDVDLLAPEERKEGISYRGRHFPTFSYAGRKISAYYDVLVATLYSTLPTVQEYTQAANKVYLVQGYETEFNPYGSEFRLQAERTYSQPAPLQYLTVSRWCESWLRDRYHRAVRYLPNGIVRSNFHVVPRDFSKDKIRILIEGDCSSPLKNIDEAFAIAARLEDRFEIWYLSYTSDIKKSYRVDRVFQKVPYEEVGRIYEQCDILLKTSRRESFSYPPLEMMATGGYCVVARNEGNAEYVRDEENCLAYDLGDIDAAVTGIHRLCEDPALRERIRAGAVETARKRDWEMIRPQIEGYYQSLYESKI